MEKPCGKNNKNNDVIIVTINGDGEIVNSSEEWLLPKNNYVDQQIKIAEEKNQNPKVKKFPQIIMEEEKEEEKKRGKKEGKKHYSKKISKPKNDLDRLVCAIEDLKGTITQVYGQIAQQEEEKQTIENKIKLCDSEMVKMIEQIKSLEKLIEKKKIEKAGLMNGWISVSDAQDANVELKKQIKEELKELDQKLNESITSKSDEYEKRRRLMSK